MYNIKSDVALMNISRDKINFHDLVRNNQSKSYPSFLRLSMFLACVDMY